MEQTQSKIVKGIWLPEYDELFNPEWRNLVFEGGRYSGKSYHVAAALLSMARNEKLRILCTREIQNTIKDSVHKLLKDIIDKYEMSDYTVTIDSVRNTVTGSEFIFKGLKLNVNEIKSMEGIDKCWVEEAQAVTKQSLDILAPTIRKNGSQLIFTYNRLNELDPVHVAYVIDKPDKTYHAHLNYDILERYGMLSDVIKLEIEKDKANPDLFAHKWLGEPLNQTDTAIIGRNSIIEAMRRTVSDDGAIEIGADIARMGNDRTVFKKRKGLKLMDTKVYTKLRTTEVCDKLEIFADWNKEILIKVDDTGVGGGVTDEMIHRGYNIMPVNFGSKPRDVDKYPNLISEAWFYMATMMDKIQLDMDSDLLMELSTRQWVMDSKGRRGVESKDTYKKRGYRSPDMADATILCFYTGRMLSMDDIYL